MCALLSASRCATTAFTSATTDISAHTTVWRGMPWRAGASVAKSAAILALGADVIAEVIPKIRHGLPPSSALMLALGSLALTANLTCLSLLWLRWLDVNMSSIFECSRNERDLEHRRAHCGGRRGGTQVAMARIAVGSIIAVVFLRSAT